MASAVEHCSLSTLSEPGKAESDGTDRKNVLAMRKVTIGHREELTQGTDRNLQACKHCHREQFTLPRFKYLSIAKFRF